MLRLVLTHPLPNAEHLATLYPLTSVSKLGRQYGFPSAIRYSRASFWS